MKRHHVAGRTAAGIALAALLSAGCGGGGTDGQDTAVDRVPETTTEEAAGEPVADAAADEEETVEDAPAEEETPRTCDPMTDRGCIMLQRGETQYFRSFADYATMEFNDKGTTRTVNRLWELVDAEIAASPGDYRFKIYGTDGYTHSDYLTWANIQGGSLYWAAALFNGSRDLSPRENDLPDVALRLVLEPLALLRGGGGEHAGILHFGGSFRWGAGPSRQGFRGLTPAGFSFMSPPEVEGKAWGATAELAWWNPRAGVYTEFQVTETARKNVSYLDPETGAEHTSLEPLRVYGYAVGATGLVWGKPGTMRGGFPPGTGLRPEKGVELVLRFEELWAGDGKAPDAPVVDCRLMSFLAGVNVYPVRHLVLQLSYVLLHVTPASLAPVEGESLSREAILRAGIVF